MKENRKGAETGFTLCLLAISAVIFALSFQMFVKTSFDLAGYGGIPVIMSFLMVLFLVLVLLEGRRAPKETDGEKKEAGFKIGYLFSMDVAIFLAMTIAYCAVLGAGIPFLLSTPVFLFASMQYLMRGYWKGNLIYTALVTVSIYVIFVMVFHVSLP